MSGDHNQHQKDKSYLDGMDRYKQVRELVKDPSLRIKDIVELTGYDKGHVSRLRKASQQFECPRCGHCCQALEKEPFEYWNAVEGWVKIDEVREHFDAVGCGTIYKSAGEGRSPLYTAPPKKEWVGLTDEQVEDEWERITGHSIFGGDRSEGRAMYISPDEVIEFSRYIEAKLKEKNHG